jgi:hypothetical protein
MPSFHEIRFRSSRCIDLRQLGDLLPEQREPFLELEADPDFYGLFIPRPPLTMNLQSVDRETAALFRTLATPAHLDGAVAAAAVDLVLDGILEIESEGGFVSGADALPLLAPPPAVPEACGAVARLSRDALLHAQDLATSDAAELTSALYLYNRIPLSPFWRTRFAGAAALLAHLGADRGALRTLLDRGWYANDSLAGWLSWTSKTKQPRRGSDVTYKLYISPRPERIVEAFEAVVRVLSDFPGTPFKIGNSASGVLRPDKLVAYFGTRELLDDAAAALARALTGCDAHGVPFSAALDESGLLSWAIDPPENERTLRWLGNDSWRSWLAKRLGAALSIAKNAHGNAAVEPWRFAIERVRRHGVDVESWTPTAALWSAA